MKLPRNQEIIEKSNLFRECYSFWELTVSNTGIFVVTVNFDVEHIQSMITEFIWPQGTCKIVNRYDAKLKHVLQLWIGAPPSFDKSFVTSTASY